MDYLIYFYLGVNLALLLILLAGRWNFLTTVKKILVANGCVLLAFVLTICTYFILNSALMSFVSEAVVEICEENGDLYELALKQKNRHSEISPSSNGASADFPNVGNLLLSDLFFERTKKPTELGEIKSQVRDRLVPFPITSQDSQEGHLRPWGNIPGLIKFRLITASNVVEVINNETDIITKRKLLKDNEVITIDSLSGFWNPVTLNFKEQPIDSSIEDQLKETRGLIDEVLEKLNNDSWSVFALRVLNYGKLPIQYFTFWTFWIGVVLLVFRWGPGYSVKLVEAEEKFKAKDKKQFSQEIIKLFPFNNVATLGSSEESTEDKLKDVKEELEALKSNFDKAEEKGNNYGWYQIVTGKPIDANKKKKDALLAFVKESAKGLGLVKVTKTTYALLLESDKKGQGSNEAPSEFSSDRLSHVHRTFTTMCDGIKDSIHNDYLINGFLLWALPSIGFVGTVIGMGFALIEADSLIGAQDLKLAIKNLAGQLGTAFDTTLVALLLSFPLTFYTSLVEKREIGAIDRYSTLYLERVTQLVAELQLSHDKNGSEGDGN